MPQVDSKKLTLTGHISRELGHAPGDEARAGSRSGKCLSPNLNHVTTDKMHLSQFILNILKFNQIIYVQV
uniref:Putative ovule protein n=1 Tax=Solanum chacoense TaxID=4108 RepID=A0A0V0H7Y9_SOLCH